jgi:hypothetical protein
VATLLLDEFPESSTEEFPLSLIVELPESFTVEDEFPEFLMLASPP